MGAQITLKNVGSLIFSVVLAILADIVVFCLY